nr:MAG TPA: hypothetical protein [Caudoviricetes sp.]
MTILYKTLCDPSKMRCKGHIIKWYSLTYLVLELILGPFS